MKILVKGAQTSNYDRNGVCGFQFVVLYSLIFTFLDSKWENPEGWGEQGMQHEWVEEKHI
jgi:hypothetical protein